MGGRYSPKAQRKIRRVLTEYRAGTLHSGRAERPVKSRRQAIAIALSQARKAGARVPRSPRTHRG